MLVVKKSNGEVVEVENVTEIRLTDFLIASKSNSSRGDSSPPHLNDLVIEAGGWGAGIRVTLPSFMDNVSVSRGTDGVLVVRLGY